MKIKCKYKYGFFESGVIEFDDTKVLCLLSRAIDNEANRIKKEIEEFENPDEITKSVHSEKGIKIGISHCKEELNELMKYKREIDSQIPFAYEDKNRKG